MPVTYDQRDTAVLEDFGLPDPTDAGAERYTNGAFRRTDAQGTYDPRTVWQSPHNSGRLLAHVVDDWVGGATYCTVVGTPFPTQRYYYSNAGKTILMVAIQYNRNANQQCTSRVTTTYAADGTTVTGTTTDTYTFDSNGFPNGFTRT